MVIMQKAVDTLIGIHSVKIKIREHEALIRISGGDARKLLNAIDIIVSSLLTSGKDIEIDNENTLSIIQQNLALYDKSGEMH